MNQDTKTNQLLANTDTVIVIVKDGYIQKVVGNNQHIQVVVMDYDDPFKDGNLDVSFRGVEEIKSPQEIDAFIQQEIKSYKPAPGSMGALLGGLLQKLKNKKQ